MPLRVPVRVARQTQANALPPGRADPGAGVCPVDLDTAEKRALDLDLSGLVGWIGAARAGR